MNLNSWSPLEEAFFPKSNFNDQNVKLPYLTVDNFPDLGLLTSLRFLEWVIQNPNGVISLPTGKTPEYFIKWTHYLLKNWKSPKVSSLLEKYNFKTNQKPNLSNLKFVQIDEFYPLDPIQKNSFYDYVKHFYIDGFKLSLEKSLLINSREIDLYNKEPWEQVFPESKIDLSLRYRNPISLHEEKQQESIYLIDQWCNEYEEKIRSLGGIGFFLGGIGPDGHIAFNVRGSDHNSTTRLMETNFETQAAAATDLGGIEISKNRLVITIGLGTITYNENATAIIIAAGEAKSAMIQKSLESAPTIKFPATCLQKLNNSRFYLTVGATKKLTNYKKVYWENKDWNLKKSQRALLHLAKEKNIFGKKISLNELREDSICKNIPNLSENTVSEIIDSIDAKVKKGIKQEKDQVYYHTGPHHDDIMLGMMPHIIHLIREPTNKHIFTNMTSGFTSVTNSFIRKIIKNTLDLFHSDKIQMINYDNFFTDGYKYRWDKDVYHYLDKIANNDIQGQNRGLSHRVVRALVEVYGVESKKQLEKRLKTILEELENSYDGQKNSPKIQKLKGMVREYEEELVWANYGVRVQDVNHLRLGFYQGEIFTEQPEDLRDVAPVLEQLKKINPTVISLALDPEGSGPDTHYKVLQTIAEAVRQWSKIKDLSNLRIWGYRNVWYKFDLAEADIIVPVTLNSLSIMNSTFMNCYLSQKEASFPSYDFDGPFSELSQKIWVNQHRDLQLMLGRDYWYRNESPHLRAVHGAVYLKEMNVSSFLSIARNLADAVEGSALFKDSI
jgi:glucosamine-6-phosphate deaminase